ncbi:hypothetical protein DERF_011173 [Dermatophagoides farinae]|uniref:ER-bound oxygenase mpaB/mpaB'/Rubber oxygenase catalytic domain-containing protein n=1 Tax=Dermatophagoides farinae TaxID=6954 RepID=A0A922KZ34_DERFA|nr:hypothetical protein DERF_011173 [Dermatophagoides farinae]
MSLIDESYAKFHSIGSKLPIDYHREKNHHLPSWIDMDRIKKIRSLYDRYSYSIVFSHLSGLLVLIFNPSIYKTLNKTGKSKNLVTTFYRYYYTAFFVREWYVNKIWLKNDIAYETLNIVKNMHANVSDKQNEGKMPNKDTMSISCVDMTLTQWAFVGFLVLYPKEIGFSLRKEDIETIVHFWAVIGHLLGIEDEYNLCLGDLHTVRKRCQLILDNDVRPHFLNYDHDSATMVERILVSYNQYIIGSRFTLFIKFVFDTIQIEKPMPITMNRMDAFFYRMFMYLLQNLYFNYAIIRFLINQYNELVIFIMKSKMVRRFIANRLQKMDLQSNGNIRVVMD